MFFDITNSNYTVHERGMGMTTYPELDDLILLDGTNYDICSLLQYWMQHDEDDGFLNPLAGRDGVSTLVEKAESWGLSGNVLQQYIISVLCRGDNEAARVIEQYGTYGQGIAKVVRHDMEILWPYLFLKPSDVVGAAYDFLDDYEPTNPKASPAFTALQQDLLSCTDAGTATKALLDHYVRYGRGDLATYMAFRLSDEGKLIGIDEFPRYQWDDLIGYEPQKEKLLTNTLHFVAGKEANNVLLTGARGTGKSTAVKALVNRFHDQGLRLVQINRDQLHLLPELLESLCNIRSKKFILFFDDLSFDEDEKEYKYLKSAIDGGVTAQPKNVVMYATSNRRHLLKETWQDRHDDLAAEVYRDDSTNESISLSDRFGLILHYGTPTQDEYLAIIDHELQKHGISIPKDKLRVLGVQWEMEHSGRNGRIAQQFVKWYLGNNN